MAYEPLPGNVVYEALLGKPTITMAANTRMTMGVVKGLMRAAKDLDAPIIFELARSESDINGGYTGILPAQYCEVVNEVAEEVDYDCYVIHADHISVKKGDDEDIAKTKELIKAQIEGGYSSFAIDASHLFDFQGGNLREELAGNINATIELAKFIAAEMGDKPFGLEVEVGEIGKANEDGRILTSPEEADTFLTALKENGVNPQVLAIANGSAHGNTYDAAGNPIEQVSIDIPQTIKVAEATNKHGVGIAQHGITGTPRELINKHFPKGGIIKGNVGTHWQNIVWSTLKIYDNDLYTEIWNWVQDTYGPKNPGKRDIEIFGKNSKFAFKQFYDRLYDMDVETEKALEAVAYAEASIFFRAFSSTGMAQVVRDYM